MAFFSKLSKYIYLFLILTFSTLYGQTQLYLNQVNGNDANDGSSESKALKTIQKAKEIVKKIKKSGDVVVNISPGEYPIETTLFFNEADKGIGNNKIIYRKYPINSQEQVLLTGGKKINNFKIFDAAKNIWVAEIGNIYSRQLYEAEKKLTRAKSDLKLKIKENGYGFHVKGIEFKDDENTSDIEVISNREWQSLRIPIKNYNLKKKTLMVKDSIWELAHNHSQFPDVPAAYIENAYILIDRPGEWYIDRKTPNGHKLFLMTNSNSEAPKNIIIPNIERLILFNNTSNISFEGIDFAYNSWLQPSKKNKSKDSNNGFINGQVDTYLTYTKDFDFKSKGIVGYKIDASITITNSDNLTFKNCHFHNIGSGAIEVLQGSHHIDISDNTFKEISGTAVSLGKFENANKKENNLSRNTNAKEISSDNTVTNNLISGVGTDYFGSVGIFISYARNSRISLNKISDFPYTGISLGWGWNNKVTYTGINEISQNTIDCSKQKMQDGGGIYILGNQGLPNSDLKTKIFQNNIINYSIRYGAIYLDTGSSNLDIYENAVTNNLLDGMNYKNINWLFIATCGVENVNITNNKYDIFYNNYYSYKCNTSNCKNPEVVTNCNTINVYKNNPIVK